MIDQQRTIIWMELGYGVRWLIDIILLNVFIQLSLYVHVVLGVVLIRWTILLIRSHESKEFHHNKVSVGNSSVEFMQQKKFRIRNAAT